METIYLKIFGFLVGASLGSFLNVLIYRLPIRSDFIFERSHCPSCKKQIPWYYNIPLFSFIMLRAKCAYCASRIPLSYFLIELAGGLVGLWLVPDFFHLSAMTLFFVDLTILTVFGAIIGIDLKHHLIPDGLNIYLAVVFLMIAVFQYSWLHWLLGGLVGFGVPFLVTVAFYKIKGQIGLGGGDIKLFGALGIILGPLGIIENIFFSCFLGSVIGILLLLSKRMDRKSPIPFGPFIVMTAIVQIYLPHYFNGIKSWLLPYA